MKLIKTREIDLLLQQHLVIHMGDRKFRDSLLNFHETGILNGELLYALTKLIDAAMKQKDTSAL